MKELLKILFLILTTTLLNCKSAKQYRVENQIIEIGESQSCGDKGGGFRYTRIRKDSTIRITGTTHNKNLNDTLKFETDKNDWEKLIHILNINDFSKLEPNLNGMGNLQSDGCYKMVYIQTIDSIYRKGGLNIFGNIKEVKTINELIK